VRRLPVNRRTRQRRLSARFPQQRPQRSSTCIPSTSALQSFGECSVRHLRCFPMWSGTLQTPEGFRSLASMLQAQPDAPIPEQPEVCGEPSWESVVPQADRDEIVRDIRLFRARIEEAVEEAVHVLLADIAADVVARELQLAPADIRAIVRRTMQQFAAEQPLRVRVDPSSVHTLDCGVPVVADESLRPGDAIVELRTGSIDATLGARLETLLHARA